MIRIIFSISCLLFCLSCNTRKAMQEASSVEAYPIIQFEKQTQDLGIIKRGEKRDLVYRFKNVGDAPLLIELVTTCKCTAIDWPRKAVLPGEEAEITATYDSTNQKLGQLKKTIDIIANTNPIVVEAFFTVEHLE